jgi:hypothetical protein
MSTSSSAGSKTTRTQYKDQIHVKGDYGTTTYRRDDDADIGEGTVDVVVDFDGVVDYKDDAIVGPVSLTETEAEAFTDDIEGRVDEYEVHTFEKNGD